MYFVTFHYWKPQNKLVSKGKLLSVQEICKSSPDVVKNGKQEEGKSNEKMMKG